jgi:hypothetical protein
MNSKLPRNVFDRFAAYLKSIDSKIDIAIGADNYGNVGIEINFPEVNSPQVLYVGMNTDIAIQLFFLGQNMQNIDELLKFDPFKKLYRSIFESTVINNRHNLDAKTYTLFEYIKNSKSIEEISIKLDLLGV